jgi:hypothetical protein
METPAPIPFSESPPLETLIPEPAAPEVPAPTPTSSSGGWFAGLFGGRPSSSTSSAVATPTRGWENEKNFLQPTQAKAAGATATIDLSGVLATEGSTTSGGWLSSNFGGDNQGGEKAAVPSPSASSGNWLSNLFGGNRGNAAPVPTEVRGWE